MSRNVYTHFGDEGLALQAEARPQSTRPGTKEPGIFKSLKQGWFGPIAEALVTS